jgi:lysophospholipase L1-like esterase
VTAERWPSTWACALVLMTLCGHAQAQPAQAVDRQHGAALVDNEMSRYWRSKVQAWAAVPAPAAGGIVFLGDSMTERFALASAFPELPAAALINRGIGGDKVGGWRYLGLLDRLQGSVMALAPRQVVLMIGVNDIVFAGTPAADLGQGLERLMAGLATGRAPVLVQAVLPVRGRHGPHNARITIFNRELRAAAQRQGFAWLDLTAAFSDSQGQLRAELAADDIHLNPAGYALWAEGLRKHLLPAR